MQGLAIVLAAGLGRRMGGPKALLEHAGRPLAARHVEAFAAASLRSYVVVRPELATRVRGLLPAADAVLVHSDAPTQSGSLVRALKALPATCEALFITPIDLLPAAHATLLALRSGLDHAHEAVTPCYRGRGGHPVLLRRRALAPLLGTDDPPALCSLLDSLGPLRRRVEVDDLNVVHDFDTPGAADRAGLSRPW